MTELAIIGGTGLTSLKCLVIKHKQMVSTPYGEPSGPLTFGEIGDQSVIFIARHGYGHTIPPHKINYRANLWALKSEGVQHIIAIAAVGGITEQMGPKTLVIPDQLIDYTYGRDHTFFEEEFTSSQHIDFTHPYDEKLRTVLIQASKKLDLNAVEQGTYAATQGPRLETAAEIDRLERDGCDIVGMTGMPEAALARELEMHYATCAVVANWGAGRGGDVVTMEEIDHNLVDGMKKVRALLEETLPILLG